MIRFDVDLVSVGGGPKLYQRVREALVCGFFMQVARKEEREYITVKENQRVSIHPSCGLDSQPEWVLFNEFILTTRPYIRTVTAVDPAWYVWYRYPIGSRNGVHLTLDQVIEECRELL